MIAQLLRQYVVPLSLAVSACQPPEEANMLDGGGADNGVECSVMAPAENHCAGDALFCDDFEERELDRDKWEGWDPEAYKEFSSLALEEGVLKMNTTAAIILHSRPSYTLDDRTYVLEARWKVGEREGTDFNAYLLRGWTPQGGDSAVGFEFGYGNETLRCANYMGPDDNEQIPCDTDVTEWHTTTVIFGPTETIYCIDGKKTATTLRQPERTKTFSIDVACQSTKMDEKSCLLDYVKWIGK